MISGCISLTTIQIILMTMTSAQPSKGDAFREITHCSALFSCRMDANKDGALTEDEIKPHMSELKELFGLDHGAVSNLLNCLKIDNEDLAGGDPDEDHRWHVATGSHWLDHGPMVVWDTDNDGEGLSSCSLCVRVVCQVA